MLTDQIKREVILHYKREYPNECCGLVVDDAYIPLSNIADDKTEYFEIDDQEYLQCSKLGEIKAIVHSHPDGSTDATMVDRKYMAYSDVSWIITNGEDFAVYDPDPDYKIPLLGRDYHHGELDCYTLIKDYYARELGIKLGDYERNDRWWEDKDHPSLYLDNFKKEGFVVVNDEIRQHDVLLCRLGRTEHINHAAIFIGDGKLQSEQVPDVIGDALILHHPYGKQSIREIYGQQWQRRTALVIRHKSML